MKKIILAAGICSLVCLMNSVFAAHLGPYMGAGAGVGRLKTPEEVIFDPNTTTLAQNTYHTGGFSGRVFAGFNLTRYFGFEAGYARYARSRYSATDTNNNTSSIRYNATAADLVGKLYLPFTAAGTHYDVYALVGVAHYMEQIKYADAGIPLYANFTPPNDGTTNVNTTRPIYGLGASFDATKQVSVHLEVTRIQKSGNIRTNPKAVPYTDLMTLGFAYSFC